MMTVEGLFGAGGTAHKFSSESFTEGRIAAKAAVNYVNDLKNEKLQVSEENYHRLIAAECHMRHIKFREEPRYPGYYYRTDFPEIDDDNWKVFVNSKYDRGTGQWSFGKVPYKQLIKD